MVHSMNDADIERIISGNNRDDDMKIIEEHCSQLLERFDTVQIFCTRYKPGDNITVDCATGIGNWSARYGQVVQWVNRCDGYEMRREE